MRRALAVALLVVSASSRPELVEQSDPGWRQPFEPIRIVGNVYYVGTRGLSSFLIVTPGGGIIIDSGEAESVPFIRANIERLGFRLSDVKILLTGHAHFDHVGGHADLKRLTGAQVMVMDGDRQALESGVDRSALGGSGWKPVAIDRVLKDGDTVTLGGYTLTAHLTPGHTQGCTTWTMETTQDGRKYQIAFTGSVTINDGVHLVDNTRVPAIAEHYAQAFRVLHGLKADVFVAQHGSVFQLEDKARRAALDPRVNPFVDPEGYQRFVTQSELTYLKQLAADRKR
ncbi:MAG TPA: subclass B3 metallo-beta-lactamase [Vicinamibacterales bacterium]|nr:subclass B3 metallo-beta-lactamase [Vicinamibacterales bacterium]